MVFDRQEYGLGRQVDEGDGRVEKYRGQAELGVDEMVRRGCGRDRRFGSASWWCWCWWRRRRRKTDGDGDRDGGGMRWVGSDHLRSIGVRVDPSRVVGVRGCAGMCVCVCVCTREEDLVRLAQNRESRIAIDLGVGVWACLSCLSLPLQAGAELSLRPGCLCANQRPGGDQHDCQPAFKFGFCSSFPFPVLDPFPCLLDFGLGRRDVLLCGYQTGSTANRGMSVPTVTTEFAHHQDHCRLS